MNDNLELDDDLLALWKQLQLLHLKLRDYTKTKYGRVNPFIENLFDWKEKGEYIGGTNVTVYDSVIVTGNVLIGSNTWVGPFCSLDGSGDLTIGSYCAISTGVRIFTHDTVKWATSGGCLPYEYSPVTIGDCCFIGANAVILRGVTIGKHCVIGANAVVNIDVPDCSLAVGIPVQVTAIP